jgi:hypothetical protein
MHEADKIDVVKPAKSKADILEEAGVLLQQAGGNLLSASVWSVNGHGNQEKQDTEYAKRLIQSANNMLKKL